MSRKAVFARTLSIDEGQRLPRIGTVPCGFDDPICLATEFGVRRPFGLGIAFQTVDDVARKVLEAGGQRIGFDGVSLGVVTRIGTSRSRVLTAPSVPTISYPFGGWGSISRGSADIRQEVWSAERPSSNRQIVERWTSTSVPSGTWVSAGPAVHCRTATTSAKPAISRTANPVSERPWTSSAATPSVAARIAPPATRVPLAWASSARRVRA